MIKKLLVRNYAIIEELEMDFSSGLTIITGETGAGKSILLGALGLIMGKRADTKSLYDTNKKCIIEAYFDIKKYDLQAFFNSNDIDYEEGEVVVRRELTPSGKSRAFVNDTPVNLKILQLLSSALIDLHQQFDTLDIHNVSFQLRMIDALAGNKKRLANYESQYRNYQSDKRKLNALISQNEKAAKETGFIRFQLEEFTKANLEQGEQEQLEEENARLTNAVDIKRILSTAFRHLGEEEQAIIEQIRNITISLHPITAFDSQLAKGTERLEGIIEELQEIANDFESIAESTEYNPERITEIQDRLEVIYALQNKHRVTTIDELVAIQTNLEQELQAFGDLSEEIIALEQSIQTQSTQLWQKAEKLSAERQKITKKFQDKVHEMLGQLSMPYALLKVDVQRLDHLTTTGCDDVNFLFAPNKGSRFLPIKDVASGGELSRLTLCTKSLVASAIPLPTMIFDEIDSGISGDVSLKMGNILRSLSNEHQVVCITHSPQIASKANTHYFVYKKIKEDTTVTNVKLLAQNEQIRAIATMLGSNPPSASAIENAKDLIMNH